MKQPMRNLLSSRYAVLLAGLLILALSTVGPTQTNQAEEGEPANAGEPAPPAGQTYIGTKNCSACHFDEFLVWRKDMHSKAFDNLPAKYRNDASCLKCHTTGYGQPSGYATSADTHLAGISCEACHGPGSKHAEICKPFANVDKLSPEQEKQARDSIYRMLPQNVCASCHASKAHKQHPEYDKP